MRNARSRPAISHISRLGSQLQANWISNIFSAWWMSAGQPARIRKLPFEEGGREGVRTRGRGNEMTSALTRDRGQISPKDIRFLCVSLSTITCRQLGGAPGGVWSIDLLVLGYRTWLVTRFISSRCEQVVDQDKPSWAMGPFSFYRRFRFPVTIDIIRLLFCQLCYYWQFRYWYRLFAFYQNNWISCFLDMRRSVNASICPTDRSAWWNASLSIWKRTSYDALRDDESRQIYYLFILLHGVNII